MLCVPFHPTSCYLSVRAFDSFTVAIFSDGHVLIFEAQEHHASVALRQAACFKLGDDAVLSLFWSASSKCPSSITCQCVAKCI
jgi:hypothetical protein